jgi:hypothetical protein
MVPPACSMIVEARVGGVLELLRDEAAGGLGGQRARAADGALHALLGRDVLDAPAERLHNLHLLARVAFRHAEHDAVAARRADEREPDAGVAGGRLHDGRAGFEDAAPLGVEDHPERRAVFDRPARVHVFELGEQVGRGRRREPRETQQRRPAHQLKDVLDGPERRPLALRILVS